MIMKKYLSVQELQNKAEIDIANRPSYILEEKGGMCDDANLNSPIAIAHAGYEKVSAGYSSHILNYPFYRLNFTFEGQMKITDPSGTHIVNTGMVYGYSPKQETHIEVVAPNTWGHYYVHFGGLKASEMMKQSTLTLRNFIFVSNPPQIQNLFETIATESMTKSPNMQKFCANYLNILLLKIAENSVGLNNLANSAISTYNECRNYIYEHYENITSIQEVADACFLSKPHLCRLYKKHAGITIHNQIMRLKLYKAASLLLLTTMSINQISDNLKFGSQFHFSKCFKKFHGVSPIRYRQNNLNQS